VSETEDYAGGDPEIGVARPKHIVVVVDVVCLEHLDAEVPAEPIVGTTTRRQRKGRTGDGARA